MVTKNLYINGDGFTIDVDYDEVALTILVIHLNNNSERDYTVKATATSNGRSYSVTVPAQTTINQAIPQGAATKLGVTVTANGRFDGVEFTVG